MIEIRTHGRGGQGAVIASKILASTFFIEGKFVQAFPMFGVERRGAPVAAFTRVDDKPVQLRMNIYEPHHVIVLDPTLLLTAKVTDGLLTGGWLVLNTPQQADDIDGYEIFRVAAVDASKIAVRHRLGNPANPIVNTAIVGAFARVSGLVELESVVQAIKDEVPIKPETNAAAARDAYEQVTIRE